MATFSNTANRCRWTCNVLAILDNWWIRISSSRKSSGWKGWRTG